MPVFVSAPGAKSRRRHRFTDGTVVNQVARRLVAASQKRVRRTSNAKPFSLGERHDVARFFALDGEGFFGVDRFARFKARHHHWPMCLRNRQVNDELDFSVGEQFVHGTGFKNIPLFGFGFSGFDVEGGARDDVEKRKAGVGGEVGVRDVAAADDANFGCLSHVENWLDP